MKGRGLAAAAGLLALIWGAMALYTLYTPIYLVKGPPIDAVIALTWSRVTFLGTPIEPGVATVVHASMIVAAVGAAAALLLGIATLYYTLREAPIPAQVASVSASIIALVSVGPLEGAAKALHMLVEDLASYHSYATNAGVIVLGEPRVEPGPALTLLSGPLGWKLAAPLNLAAYAQAMAAALFYLFSSSGSVTRGQGFRGSEGGAAAGGSGNGGDGSPMGAAGGAPGNHEAAGL